MAKIGVDLPEEMHRAVERVQEKTNLPTSTLVRLALQKYLKEYGEDVPAKMQWGGKRQPKHEARSA